MSSRGILGLALSLGLLAGWSVPSAAQSEEARASEKLTLGQMLERLPQRVKSKEGTQGDMVNFFLIGPKAKMEDALRAAGWVEAHRDPQQAVLHAIQSTLNQQGYTELPMSLLYLFGRPQDYGFAHAIPLQVAAERHHFRLWQAPWTTSDGQTVWIGAGTHDIGVERTIQGKLTHQIDPDVDKEREYVADSLLEADRVQVLRYLTPTQPVLSATTTTGASYHSDGRILVIFLK